MQSNTYWVANVHSLGGLSFWRACQSITNKKEDVLHRIYVESIASTKVFDEEKDGFRNAKNSGGLSDLVTHISDPTGLVWRGILHGQYNFVGHPFQPPCFSHAYLSNDYKGVLKEIANRH
jgi:hypothetical protein